VCGCGGIDGVVRITAARRLLLGRRAMMQVLPDAVSAADCRRRRVETVMCGSGGDRVAGVLARPVGESPKTPARAKRRLRPPPVGDDAHRGRLSFPRTHAARTHGHPSPPPKLPPAAYTAIAPNTAPPFHPHTPTSHRQPVAETVGRPETIIVRFRWYYYYYYINECGVHRRVEIDIEAPRVVKFPNTSIYVNRHSPIHCYHNSGLSREWVAVGSSALHRQAPAQWVI